MQFALGDSGRFINKQWHRVRQEARETTMTLSEWGDVAQTKYDLDTVDFSGKQNDETYRFRHSVNDDEIDVTGFDVRDLPGHE